MSEPNRCPACNGAPSEELCGWLAAPICTCYYDQATGNRYRNLTPHGITLRDAFDRDVVLSPDPQGPARVDSSPGVWLSETEENDWCGCDSHQGYPELMCYDCTNQLKMNTPAVRLYLAPQWGEVLGLPAPQPKVILIVSAVVAARCVGRADVFSPGTGPHDECVRENGQVVAVTRLVQAPNELD